MSNQSATSANLQFDKAEESALRWAIDILSAQLTPPKQIGGEDGSQDR